MASSVGSLSEDWVRRLTYVSVLQQQANLLPFGQLAYYQLMRTAE